MSTTTTETRSLGAERASARGSRRRYVGPWRSLHLRRPRRRVGRGRRRGEHPRAARGDRRRSHADRHGAQLWHRALRASRRAGTGRTARNGAGLSRRGNQIRPTHG